MLCEACLRAFSSGFWCREHHDSLASLTKAATDGCYICTPLWKSIREEATSLQDGLETELCIGRSTGDSFYKLFGYFPEDDILDHCCLTTSVRKNKSVADGFRKTLDWEPFAAAPTANVPVYAGTYGRESTIPMVESLQAAQKWMSTCVDTHEQCRKHTQPHAYPTRLLELGGRKVRLILPQEEETLGPYAALSYCWGPNPSFIQLTADNMGDFRLGIIYCNLPIAFQEAIRFIKGLGIRYLWIDALCIIQSGIGSSEDWRSECGRMQEVYSNCIINVSLAQAAHPDQSCMRGHSGKTILPFTTEMTLRNRHGVITGNSAYTIIPNKYFEQALYQQPIGSRAWVLQERLLATRVLSFGRGELFWDCREVPNASETLPYGFTLCSKSGREVLGERLGLQIPSIPQSSDSRILEQAWSKILVEYSARELTYPHVDKLIALSAISKCMGHAFDDPYLVGHFWKTLPQSLNWRAHRWPDTLFRAHERPPHRLSKLSSQSLDGDWVVTPTWSWASMNGRLRTRMTDGPLLKFIAIPKEYRLFSLGKNQGRPHMENLMLLTIRAWCKPLKCTLENPGAVRGIKILTEECCGKLRVIMDEPNEELNHGSEHLLAVLGRGGYLNNWAEGLLLKETNSYGIKVYERLGHFSGSFDIKGIEWESCFAGGQRSITIC